MSYDNDLLLRTIKGETVERPPVWIMRQAGRILPEYRAVRASVDGFKALVTNPELAATVTVQPVDILDVDAAILFSDILVIPECMGLDYEMIPGKGPYFPKVIAQEGDIDNLIYGEEAALKLDYVFEGIDRTKEKLDGRVPLLGFSGAPWTLFCYMLEGEGSKTFFKAKSFLYKYPEASHRLLGMLTDTVIHYLKQKIKHGVDVVQVFDSWAGVLNKSLYNTFCIPYLQRIVEAIEEAPVIVFSKGAYFAMDEIVGLNSDVVGLDWTLQASEVRAKYPHVCLQGNMDPCVLYAAPEDIEKQVHATIAAFKSKHIFNLGHGVYPTTDKAHVAHMVKCVKSYRYT